MHMHYVQDDSEAVLNQIDVENVKEVQKLYFMQ